MKWYRQSFYDTWKIRCSININYGNENDDGEDNSNDDDEEDNNFQSQIIRISWGNVFYY